jgi:hypothetical protein
MDPQDELKNLSVAFVLSLTRPELTDWEVAWQGIMATFAASRIPGTIGDPNGLPKAVERLRRITVAGKP